MGIPYLKNSKNRKKSKVGPKKPTKRGKFGFSPNFETKKSRLSRREAMFQAKK